jgi:hypothetical protein
MLGRKKKKPQTNLTPAQQKEAREHMWAGVRAMASTVPPTMCMLIPIGRKRRGKKIEKRWDLVRYHFDAAVAIVDPAEEELAKEGAPDGA